MVLTKAQAIRIKFNHKPPDCERVMYTRTPSGLRLGFFKGREGGVFEQRFSQLSGTWVSYL